MAAGHQVGSVEAGQAAAGYMEKGATVIYVAAQGKLQGVLALADTLREESAQMIRDLSAVGVEPVLLTGDHEKCSRFYRWTAGHPGSALGLPAGR